MTFALYSLALLTLAGLCAWTFDDLFNELATSSEARMSEAAGAVSAREAACDRSLLSVASPASLDAALAGDGPGLRRHP